MSSGLPNTRVQRTRSSASPPHSPLTRRPLGRPKPSGRWIPVLLAVVVVLSRAGEVTASETGCEHGSHAFQETAGAVVFSVGTVSQLRRALTFAVVVRDDEGECGKIKRMLVKRIATAFPAWQYVSAGSEDLTIVYESGFSLCLDDCEDQPLPQGANVELVLRGDTLKAHWSDGSHWRARGRLVDLFVSSLRKVLNERAA